MYNFCRGKMKVLTVPNWALAMHGQSSAEVHDCPAVSSQCAEFSFISTRWSEEGALESVSATAAPQHWSQSRPWIEFWGRGPTACMSWMVIVVVIQLLHYYNSFWWLVHHKCDVLGIKAAFLDNGREKPIPFWGIFVARAQAERRSPSSTDIDVNVFCSCTHDIYRTIWKHARLHMF
jgi:hypothetical protein